ncbi:MAG: 50S ribosomal protein L25/general stress protein Ctc [Cyclobacteriaceae bacterium]|nr:50S ribosomal protein L25/general stress protein Ctc [Cyclobacteriaceae bacterium]
MKTIEIIGYKRANLGKAEAKKLRLEANVPCVLYGGDKQVHFYAPMILFRKVIYTQDAHFVSLNIEGEEFQAIIQDVQFHPVSEIILHADFLQLFEGKKIKMDVPVKLVGQSPAVMEGGVLIHKRRKLTVLSLPKNMPSHIDCDISNLLFHHSVKVQDVIAGDYEILDTKIASIAVVEIPRALKTAAEEEEEAAAEAAEAAEGEETAEGEESTEAKTTE